MSGGVSWAEAANPMLSMSSFLGFLFLCFIFFSIFSVLNIVTGVFVDGAIQHNSEERDVLMDKQKKRKDEYLTELEELLLDIDDNEDGIITLDEFEQCLQDERFAMNFMMLDIDPGETKDLFNVLDANGDGLVEIQEFLAGCLRIKGEAKGKDVHQLIFESRLLSKKFQYLWEFVDTKLSSMQSQIDAQNRHASSVVAALEQLTSQMYDKPSQGGGSRVTSRVVTS